MATDPMLVVQQAICAARDAQPDAPGPDELVGIARDYDEDVDPIVAVRHPREGELCGWLVWSGETEPDVEDETAFEGIPASEVATECPRLVPYLALPAGWTVVLGLDSYVETTYDPALLD
jgi:hypothetical protein